ncbi:MAG TPA: hypothetical protein VGC65_09340 [Bacteroidia bacterium]|jgi:hypothetical protein
MKKANELPITSESKTSQHTGCERFIESKPPAQYPPSPENEKEYFLRYAKLNYNGNGPWSEVLNLLAGCWLMIVGCWLLLVGC